MHTRPIVIVLLTALALSLLSGCGGESTPARPNIVLVSIDALRQDHVSAYGYERETTPFIDSWAAQGVRFDNAHSVSCWTVPSVASLVTSVYPDKHGVVHGVVQKKDGRIAGQEILDADLPRIAEALKAAGYTTFGLTANGHLEKRLGYAQGFDYYMNFGFGKDAHLTADAVNEQLEAWKDHIQANEPYFLWVHYFDPHAFYHDRQPWLETFYPEYAEMQAKLPDLTRTPPTEMEEMGIEPGSPELDYLIALYDSEIGYVDQAIREMFTSLGIDKDHVVVFTADHGEEFLDHGGFDHTGTLYEELTAVPLIMNLPGRSVKGHVAREMASLVDIGPTILDYIGEPAPPAMQGVSLLAAAEGHRGEVHDAILTSLSRRPYQLQGLNLGPWKYIADGGKDGPPNQMFNLRKDPGETENLANEESERVYRMRKKAKEMAEGYASDKTVEIDTEGLSPEEIEKLKSLGYVR